MADGHFAQVILYSRTGGKYKGLNIPVEFQPKVVESFIKCKKGDLVPRYENSSHTAGALIIRLDGRADMMTGKLKQNMIWHWNIVFI